jgi:hypothetical protein
VGEAAIFEGGDRLAIAAAGVMESIGEIEAGAQARYRLLYGRAILQGEGGMAE